MQVPVAEIYVAQLNRLGSEKSWSAGAEQIILGGSKTGKNNYEQTHQATDTAHGGTFLEGSSQCEVANFLANSSNSGSNALTESLIVLLGSNDADENQSSDCSNGQQDGVREWNGNSIPE